ncbi:type II toxin-antitoxin system HipA family toxin [Erwinia sp. AnSW2-5]|uniref:type II toxin-antitoxin system HipA family toxin n=1 Tax=Erwinia sp. AnSW2-5 TaxID=3367692 RepID=UPI0038598E9B
MAKLIAWMNSVLVGELTKLTNGAHTFKYDASWIQNSHARPLSLSLPLQIRAITSDAVFNYFDNLLPDNPVVRDRIVKRYGARSKQPFDLLAEIGRDSVGAVTLLPPDEEVPDRSLRWEALDAGRLETILTAYQADIPLGMVSDEQDFRISVAGAQEKIALLKIDATWCIPKGMTPTTHIIKLPIGEIKQPTATMDLSESVDNEYLCLALARELGFEVPDTEIIRTEKIRALAVERFDRRWVDNRTALLRLPQEDLCQAFGLPSSVKYESEGGPDIPAIMDFLLGSSEALKDRYNFMKFQVFQWLLGATDGHAKNYSIFIQPGGSYRLTPFYDIISAYPVLGGQGLHISQLKLAMNLKATKGRKNDIHTLYPRHFMATAKEVKFAEEQMNEILNFFADAIPDAIEAVTGTLPDDFSPKIYDDIVSNVRRIHARLLS